MEGLIAVKWWLIHPLHDRVRNPFVSNGSALGFFSSVVRPNNYIYRPQTKLRRGNGFTPVCQSFCSRGGICPSACWDTQPPPPPWADTAQADTHLSRYHLGRHPHPWVDTPGQTPPWTDTPLGRHPPADGYCCERYASYWNAFLSHPFSVIHKVGNVRIFALFKFEQKIKQLSVPSKDLQK